MWRQDHGRCIVTTLSILKAALNQHLLIQPSSSLKQKKNNTRAVHPPGCFVVATQHPISHGNRPMGELVFACTRCGDLAGTLEPCSCPCDFGNAAPILAPTSPKSSTHFPEPQRQKTNSHSRRFAEDQLPRLCGIQPYSVLGSPIHAHSIHPVPVQCSLLCSRSLAIRDAVAVALARRGSEGPGHEPVAGVQEPAVCCGLVKPCRLHPRHKLKQTLAHLAVSSRPRPAAVPTRSSTGCRPPSRSPSRRAPRRPCCTPRA